MALTVLVLLIDSFLGAFRACLEPAQQDDACMSCMYSEYTVYLYWCEMVIVATIGSQFDISTHT